MSSKQEKIKKLLEMQNKFIELEQQGEVTAQNYWAPEEGSELHGYKEDYMKLAMEIVEAAHEEKGSHQ